MVVSEVALPSIEPEWKKFERDVQERLGLSLTISSGNKWYDQGDATNRTHFKDEIFPVVVDCKTTGNVSYLLGQRTLSGWCRSARKLGKNFILPIRFLGRKKAPGETTEFVVMSWDSFLELWDLIHPDS